MNPKLKATADRNVANEATLLWTGAGILFFFISLFSPISLLLVQIGFSPLGGDIVFGILVGGVFALAYYLYYAKRVEQARVEYNNQMKALKAQQREQHLQNLKNRQAQQEGT